MQNDKLLIDLLNKVRVCNSGDDDDDDDDDNVEKIKERFTYESNEN